MEDLNSPSLKSCCQSGPKITTSEKNEVQDFYSMKNPAEVESDLARVCSNQGISYALTAFSGAARLAPLSGTSVPSHTCKRLIESLH